MSLVFKKEQSNSRAIFSTAYLPSVEYLMLLSNHSELFIDQNEKWQKQTVRNRCFILSPNGLQTLVIPVKHKQEKPVLIRDIRISYEESWIRVHKGAILTAYNTSPNFEYLKDDLWAFYDRKFEFLIDLNQTILEWLLKKFKVSTQFKNTNDPLLIAENKDFRSISDSASTLPILLKPDQFNTYPQVFGYKHPFHQNVSSFDLLCNGGKL